MGANGYLKTNGSYLCLRVPNGATEIAGVYRALAAECIDKQIARVLVTGADGDPAAERALRDAFSEMLLAGIPAGFRIALVIDMAEIAPRFRTTQRDLKLVGIEMKFFGGEDEAARWLAGA